MNKTLISLLGIAGAGIALVLILVVTAINTANEETRLATTIEQKQRDNKNANTKMWQIIDQSAQVSQAQKDALVEIFTSYATARGNNSQQPSQALANWIHEAVPNADTDTFKQLQRTIESQRESFAMRQTELLDLKREHDSLLRSIPSGQILAFFGRKPIEVQIVTSTRTEEAFATGVDDNVDLFRPKNSNK